MSNKVRALNFGLSFHLLPHFVYANSEGSESFLLAHAIVVMAGNLPGGTLGTMIFKPEKA